MCILQRCQAHPYEQHPRHTGPKAERVVWSSSIQQYSWCGKDIQIKMRSPRSSHTWGKDTQYVCNLHIWSTAKDVAKEMETLKTNNEGRITHIQLLGGECSENISLKGWQHSLGTSLVTSYKRKGLTHIYSSSSMGNHSYQLTRTGYSKQQTIPHSS